MFNINRLVDKSVKIFNRKLIKRAMVKCKKCNSKKLKDLGSKGIENTTSIKCCDCNYEFIVNLT